MRLSLFDRIVLIISCLGSITLLLSYLAPIVNPQQVWIIAILGLLYPFLLALSCIFIVYWLLRKPKLALIPAGCILIGVKILFANVAFHVSTPLKAKSPQSIRIMAYNVHGFLSTKLTEEARDSILKLINTQQPDILNIEEFSVNVNTRKIIYNSLKTTMLPAYKYVKQYEYTPYDSSGVAIFSKYPIVNKGTVFSTPDTAENQAIFVDLKKENKIFRVYCVHLKSVRFNDKEHIYIKKLTHYGKVNLAEMKVVKNKLKSAFINRSYQACVIKKHMDQCPYPYIIAGDFNDTPISYAVNKIGDGLKNAFQEKSSGLGFTYYGDFPNLQIDYIFASKQFRIERCQCLQKKLSDHYPIISDVLLTP